MTRWQQWAAITGLGVPPKRALALVDDGLGLVTLRELCAPVRPCAGCSAPLDRDAPEDGPELCGDCGRCLKS